MSQRNSIKLNLEQNQPNFELESLEESPLIVRIGEPIRKEEAQ